MASQRQGAPRGRRGLPTPVSTARQAWPPDAGALPRMDPAMAPLPHADPSPVSLPHIDLPVDIPPHLETDGPDPSVHGSSGRSLCGDPPVVPLPHTDPAVATLPPRRSSCGGGDPVISGSCPWMGSTGPEMGSTGTSSFFI